MGDTDRCAGAPLHENLGVDPGDLRIGVAERFFEEYVSEGVESTVREAIDALEAAGADVVDVTIPALDYSAEPSPTRSDMQRPSGVLALERPRARPCLRRVDGDRTSGSCLWTSCSTPHWMPPLQRSTPHWTPTDRSRSGAMRWPANRNRG